MNPVPHHGLFTTKATMATKRSKEEPSWRFVLIVRFVVVVSWCLFQRFMESRLFLSELHKAHEPQNRKCLEINGTVFRFMGRRVVLLSAK